VSEPLAVRPMHPFHRTELLVGAEGMDRLSAARACVIGLGGVGGYVVEALARSGIGHLTLVDFDVVCITNVNRQIHASRKTVRKSKAQLAAERCADIHPKGTYVPLDRFYDAETSEEILGPGFDLVFDCIDNMTAKVHLLETCVRKGLPVFSAMGAGGRTDPTRIRVSDLSETRGDPFARIVRDLLRQRGIESGVRCVWSDEAPNDLDEAAEASFRCICPDKDLKSRHSCEQRHQVQGTVAWMPAISGLTLAAAGVHHLLGRPELADRVTQAERAKSRRLGPSSKPSRAKKKQLAAAVAPGSAEETPQAR
jgi:tRNA A37 threonylcarbamoyladenosine dehydratase